MTTTTVKIPGGVIYTTKNPDGTVTISDTPPNTSTPKSSNAQRDVGSNSTKGVVETREVAKNREGNPVDIRRNDNGTIRSVEDRDAARRKAEEAKTLREQGEALEKAKATAAKAEANQQRGGGIGISGQAKLVLFGREIVNFEKKAGHIPTDTSLGYEMEVGDKLKKIAGKEDVPTPGLSIGVGVSISARRQEKMGISENQRELVLKAKEMKGEYDKVYEKAQTDLKNKVPPQQVNEQLAKDLADLGRKWGKEAGEAALK